MTSGFSTISCDRFYIWHGQAVFFFLPFCFVFPFFKVLSTSSLFLYFVKFEFQRFCSSIIVFIFFIFFFVEHLFSMTLSSLPSCSLFVVVLFYSVLDMFFIFICFVNCGSKILFCEHNIHPISFLCLLFHDCLPCLAALSFFPPIIYFVILYSMIFSLIKYSVIFFIITAYASATGCNTFSHIIY